MNGRTLEQGTNPFERFQSLAVSMDDILQELPHHSVHGGSTLRCHDSGLAEEILFDHQSDFASSCHGLLLFSISRL